MATAVQHTATSATGRATRPGERRAAHHEAGENSVVGAREGPACQTRPRAALAPGDGPSAS
jgi:hypothetical protein